MATITSHCQRAHESEAVAKDNEIRRVRGLTYLEDMRIYVLSVKTSSKSCEPRWKILNKCTRWNGTIRIMPSLSSLARNQIHRCSRLDHQYCHVTGIQSTMTWSMSRSGHPLVLKLKPCLHYPQLLVPEQQLIPLDQAWLARFILRPLVFDVLKDPMQWPHPRAVKVSQRLIRLSRGKELHFCWYRETGDKTITSNERSSPGPYQATGKVKTPDNWCSITFFWKAALELLKKDDHWSEILYPRMSRYSTGPCKTLRCFSLC